MKSIINNNLAEFVKVEAESFPEGERWQARDFQAVARDPFNVGYTAEHPERGLVAFIVLKINRANNRKATIMNLAVVPEFRRKRIAWEMLAGACDLLRIQRFRVTVRESNLGAQLFYKALGFRAVKYQRDCFGVGVGGIRFIWRPGKL